MHSADHRLPSISEVPTQNLSPFLRVLSFNPYKESIQFVTYYLSLDYEPKFAEHPQAFAWRILSRLLE